MKAIFSKYVPPFFTLLGLCFIWESVAYFEWLPSFILPSLSDIFKTLLQDRLEFLAASQETLISAVWGFSLSVAVGFFFSALMALSKTLFRSFYPFTVVIQTLPIVALAPLFVIWFGYGRPTVIASTFIASIFPILSATLSGLASTEKERLELFKIYHASKWFTLFHLTIPSAIPQVLIGLRIGVGLAIIGTVVGEFVGSGGLGSIIDIAKTQQRVDKVFAAVFLISLIGILSVEFINLFSRFVLKKWYHIIPK